MRRQLLLSFFLGCLMNCAAVMPAAAKPGALPAPAMPADQPLAVMPASSPVTAMPSDAKSGPPPPAHMIIEGCSGGFQVLPETHWVFAGESEWHLEHRGAGSLEMAHLTLAAGTFYLEAGTALTVKGHLENLNGGKGLVLRADEGATASLIHHSSKVKASVERFVTGVPDWSASPATHWNLLSSPVDAHLVNGLIADPDRGQGQSDLYGWDEVAGQWVNVRQSEDFEAFNNGMNLNPGQGYLVAYEKDQTLVFEGELGSENVEYNGLTLTGDAAYSGWHLLGNPFASSLDWNASGWLRNGVLGEVHVWDNQRGNYISANGGLGDFDGIIGPQQGIFVKVAAPDKDGSVQFPAAARVHPAKPFPGKADGKSGKTDLPPGVLRLEVKATDTENLDVLYVRLDGSDSLAYDPGYDAHKLFGAATAPSLMAFKQDRALSIISLPPEVSGLPLWFGEGASQQFTLQVAGTAGLDPHKSLWLEDLASGDRVNLRQQTVHHFAAGSVEGARFMLEFKESAATAVPGGDPAMPLIDIYTYGSKLYIRLPDNLFPATVRIAGLDGRVLKQTSLGAGGLHELSLPGSVGPVVVMVHTPGGRGKRKLVGR